eukprot:Skav209222  [mRNA]  locus=scaffold3787:68361:70165:+ [translate_table: standard]
MEFGFTVPPQSCIGSSREHRMFGYSKTCEMVVVWKFFVILWAPSRGIRDALDLSRTDHDEMISPEKFKLKLTCTTLGGDFIFFRNSPPQCQCDTHWEPSEKCGHDRTLDLRLLAWDWRTQYEKPCYCAGTWAESKWKGRDVRVSAMRFCQKLLDNSRLTGLKDLRKENEKGRRAGKGRDTRLKTQGAAKIMHDKLKGAKERCQAALTHANNFSINWEGDSPPHDQDGRVDRFTSSWHWSLDKVCSDECEELVRMMDNQRGNLSSDMFTGKPSHELCAKRVVQHVEADILGCCARSCGWDGTRCRFWPLFDNSSQALWQEECCSEWTILKGSKREEMCDSVLNQTQKKDVEKEDPEPEETGDPTLVGQDPQNPNDLVPQSFLDLGDSDNVECRDTNFLKSCGKQINHLQEHTCESLKGWHVIKHKEVPLLQKNMQRPGCHRDKGLGACNDLGGGRLFRWFHKEEEGEESSQACCPLSPWKKDWEKTKAEDVKLYDLMASDSDRFLVRKP